MKLCMCSPLKSGVDTLKSASTNFLLSSRRAGHDCAQVPARPIVEAIGQVAFGIVEIGRVTVGVAPDVPERPKEVRRLALAFSARVV